MKKMLIDYIREVNDCNYFDINDYFKDLSLCDDEFKVKYLMELFIYIHKQEYLEKL